MLVKWNDRVVMTKNNYLRFVGNMSAQEVDIDKIMSSGEELNAKISSIIEEETNKGNDDLKVIPDLLDLNVLADPNRFTDDIKQLMSLSLALSDGVRALNALGFNNPTSYGAFNVASAQVSVIAKKVAMRLYYNLVASVNGDSSGDDIISDIALDAIVDQIKERMSFIKFVDEFDIEIPEGVDPKTLEESYSGQYEEWVETEAERLFKEIMLHPTQNQIIYPTGADDVRSVLYEILPQEANEWIAELSESDLYSGDVFETLMNKYKLQKEDLKKFAHAVDLFIKENAIATEVGVGNGQSVAPFYSINLASVILHMMITASAELWGSNEELSEETEYIVDLFRQELEDISCIEYNEFTPYKLLSIVSSINNIIISRTAYGRASSQDYILAQGAITYCIYNDLMKDTVKEQEINFGDDRNDR